ncbi:thioesterase II family protein [Vibrio ostreicida]|uniref:thioesterase II family protein n=1 Tax=Vibrio ostreicida TaxID=526588 RepID=UPI003B5B63C4
MNPVFKTLSQSKDKITDIWVIFPFAGGSYSAFKSWTQLEPNVLPNQSLVLLATYPGRDQRMREQPLSSINELAEQLFDALLIWRKQTPAAQAATLRLCGHSMGAQVAFEVCKQFEDHFGPTSPIRQLILSGCHAPHLEGRRKLSHLDDEPFVDQLIAIGSGSPVLKQHPELLPVFLPMLRADFTATEGYLCDISSSAKLNMTPCTLVYGEQDPEAWPSEVNAWQAWINTSTQVEVTVCALQGDHFYITAQPQTFIQKVLELAAAPVTLANTCTDAHHTAKTIFGEHHG